MAERTLAALFERLRGLGRRPFLDAPKEARRAADCVAFVESWAAQLRAEGLSPGDRVLVHLPHGPAQAMALFAVTLAGGVVVLANSRSKAAQLRALSDDCEPFVVCTDESLTSVVDAEEAFGTLRTVRLQWAEGGELRWNGEALARPRGFEAVDRSPEDLAVLLYTSGSTGRPKGVMQSHGSLVDGARIVSGYLGLRDDDHLFGLLPLSFDYGLNQLTSAAQVGARLTLRPFLNGRDLVQALSQSGATVCAGVPEVQLALVDALRELGAGGLALRIVTNSGGAFPQRALDAYRELLPGVTVFSMYGLTEAFRSSFVPPAELTRLRHTVGRAMPEVELLVVDPRSGEVLPSDQEGELVHCGACVARGYWRRPEATALRFRPDPRGRPGLCVFSGDLATRSEDGVVTLLGRSDAQLKIHGQRISPDEVTAVVRTVAGVVSAGAVAVPRGADGQSVLAVAVVVEASSDAGSIPATVRATCRRELPPHMVPTEIWVLDSLPLSQNHKLDHQRLRELLAAREPEFRGPGAQRDGR